MEKYGHALSMKKPKAKAEKPMLKEMHIKPAKGGAIIRHEHHNAADEHHVVKTMGALKKHMEEHMPMNNVSSETPEMEPSEGTEPNMQV